MSDGQVVAWCILVLASMIFGCSVGYQIGYEQSHEETKRKRS